MNNHILHILIAGSGTMLPHLTRHFHSQGHRVSLVVPDAREADELSRTLKASVYIGDATDPEVLAEIWTTSVDLVIALTPRDHDNLGICRMAQQHFNAPRVFAITSNPENVDLFAKLDVEAFCPTQVVAQMIQQRSVTDAVRGLSAIAGGKLLMTEYVTDANDAICNRTLAEAAFPPDVLIACIMRDDMPILPRGDTRIAAGDALTIITTPGRQDEALHLLTKG
ncbi:MAG: TrkA family potassium uptake protein [Bacteroidota bacterium]|jgi:trk system potassium uptake protein TrkA